MRLNSDSEVSPADDRTMRGLVGVVLACLVGMGLGWFLFRSNQGVPVRPPGLDWSRWNAAVARLEDAAGRLAELRSRPVEGGGRTPAGHAEAGSSGVASPEGFVLVSEQEVREVRSLFREARDTARKILGPGRMLEEMARLPRGQPEDWVALRSLCQGGWSAASREVYFLSAADVLGKFGAPSALESSEDSVTWIYLEEAPDAEGRRLRVSFVFRGGRVVQLFFQNRD